MEQINRLLNFLRPRRTAIEPTEYAGGYAPGAFGCGTRERPKMRPITFIDSEGDRCCSYCGVWWYGGMHPQDCEYRIAVSRDEHRNSY